MQKTKWFLFIVLFLSHGVLAYAEMKPKMDEMLQYIYDLKPLITSETRFQDPANGPLINSTLQKMIVLSEKIKHEDKVKKTALQVPAMSMSRQLKEAQSVFNSGNKFYSLWLVRANLSNCVACHTQLPAQSTRFGSKSKSDFLVNTFQEAEFLYIVRNFDKAIDMYDRALAEYPGNQISPQDLDQAIFRKVFYFTRVKRDMKALSASLTKNLKNEDLLPSTARLLKDYSDAAKQVATEKIPPFKSDNDVKAYVEKSLDKELVGEFAYGDAKRNLRNLRLSGFLYEYLDKNPDTELKPYIYYWLSFCESRWERGLQDSLPESYLRKCITEFPKSPIAPKCFKEYEDLMKFGYTGSAGTNIPPDIQEELQKMRDSVGIKK